MRKLPEGYIHKAQNRLNNALPLEGRIADLGGKTFIGTKVIHATPMTRQAYCDLRGWSLPTDEDGSDPGYLIQYADQENTNVDGFTGYVSWSPADVFDAAYEPINMGEL